MLFATVPGRTSARRRQPSLRGRLLAYVLLPALCLMLADTALVYMMAIQYSKGVHDRDLVYSALGLADAIEDGRSDGKLSGEARALLEYDPQGRTFYSVRSRLHGFVGGSVSSLAPPHPLLPGKQPVLYDANVAGLHVRAASLSIWSPTERGDSLEISIAESLNDRQLVAREILMLTLPVEVLLIAVLLTLMWHGVGFGLRILDLPIRQLAESKRTLAPLSSEAIPVEILPLTHAIDGLFERVQALLALQERFVADAAHQLRTPLAGLAMHVERARRARTDAEREAALAHVHALTSRVTRSATQLLSLARAQSPQTGTVPLVQADLAQLLPELVATRVPEALEDDIDLGYESDGHAAVVLVQAGAMEEVLDNLVDNALHYTPRGGTITVSARVADAYVQVAIDDSGPGVAEPLLRCLGERFFRAPNAVEGGSGLGLAIVRRIAELHGATLGFTRSELGGLRVEMRFPLAAGTP
jgi:two-component system sensor histidine kinase TctE